MYETSRRGFLKSAGAVSLATIGGLEVTDAFAGPLAVRRNVGNMSSADPVLLTYRRAIKAMKALPTSDPRSWAYQAAIHGTMASPPLTAWNTCEHSPQFFWSWHRMYLYWFERIVRRMAGDCEPCWALPYWDWSSPTQRQLPAPFRDTGSELFESDRKPEMNDGSGSLSSFATDVTGAFAAIDFIAASSAFNGPHGSVHIGVGGGMGSVPTAAKDPIFYLHHSNVDRQWNLWLAQGGRTDPFSDATWKTRKFTFFDENGIEVLMTSCQVVRAAEQLNYVYEGEPEQVRQYCERFRFPWVIDWRRLRELTMAPIRLGRKPVSVDLGLGELRAELARVRRSDDEVLSLDLDDVVTDKQPEIIWEVHLGAIDARAGEKSPSFLGVVALFGDGVRDQKHGDHGFTPAKFTLPITGALLDRMKSGKRVKLTFVPRGVLINGKPGPLSAGEATVGRVSLSLQTRRPAPSTN